MSKSSAVVYIALLAAHFVHAWLRQPSKRATDWSDWQRLNLPLGRNYDNRELLPRLKFRVRPYHDDLNKRVRCAAPAPG